MSEAFLGEIRLVPWTFAPRGWAFCNGQLLAINQNQALFSLIGTTYGGDGRTNFALPDLRGRTPVHIGDEVWLGQQGGASTHSLTGNEVPVHTHELYAATALATTGSAQGNMFGRKGRLGRDMYGPAGAGTVVTDARAIGANAGSQPHSNMQPYLVMNFAICVSAGIFPSRS